MLRALVALSDVCALAPSRYLRNIAWSALALLLLSSPLLVRAQAPDASPPTDAARQIEALLLAAGLRRPAPPPSSSPSAPPAPTLLDLRLRLEPPPTPPPVAPAPTPQLPSVTRLALIDRREVPAEPAPERNPQFHPSLLLAAAVGPNNELLSWTLVRDPRLLRAEFPTPSGRLEGQTLSRPHPELLLSFPNHPQLREVRLYERIWPSPALAIRLLATAPLPEAQP